MDGWDWEGMGWDGMVIIGDRYSKSTFGDNKKLPIWMWKKCIKQPWIYTWKDHPLPFPIHLAGFTGVCTNILHPGDESCSLILNIARSCRLKLLGGLVAYVRCWCTYAELAIELGIRIFSYVSEWTESECPSLIDTLQIIVRDAPWYQFCSFLTLFKNQMWWCTEIDIVKVLYIFPKLC